MNRVPPPQIDRPAPASLWSRDFKPVLGALLESSSASRFFEGLWNLRNHSRQACFPARPTRSRELTVEVTNICNANCVFCGYQFQERPTGVMSLDLFRQIVDQYAAIGGGMIELTPVVGDPLVDKGLEEKVGYARSVPGIGRLSFITNGILLRRARFEALVAAGITHITISISGLDPKEYERVYRSTAYRTVIDNLVDIAASPLFGRVEFALGIRSDTWFAWRRSPDLARLKRLGYTRVGSMLFLDNWSGRIATATLPGAFLVRPPRRKKNPCWMLYNSITVLADGRMTACGCRDLNGTSELGLGSIHDQRLDSPWIDGRMEALRQRFRDGNPPDVCRDCRHYVPAREIDALNSENGKPADT